MNLLYAYPVFLPVSGGDGEISMKIVWSTLIVTNVIWLISLVVAIIHNSVINKGRNSFRDVLMDRWYFCNATLLAVVIDFIAVFVGLVFWVATLI